MASDLPRITPVVPQPSPQADLPRQFQMTADGLSPLLLARQRGLRAVVGSTTVTVPSGTREGSSVGVALGVGFVTPPIVVATIQTLSATASAERPVVAAINNATSTTFDLFVNTGAAVAANRNVVVGWIAVG